MPDQYVSGRSGGTGRGRAASRKARDAGGLTVSEPLEQEYASGPAKAPEWKVQQAILLRDEARDRYDTRNRMIQDMRALHYQEGRVDIPAQYRGTTKEVRLPLLADQSDLMAAIIDDSPRVIHVDPVQEGPSAGRNASLRERWSEAIVDQVQQELNRPVLSMLSQNLSRDGMAVLKVVYRGDHWSDLPDSEKLFGGRAADTLNPKELKELKDSRKTATKGARLPFSWVDVDPMTYMPVYGPTGEVEAVIELTERPIRAVLASYNKVLAYKKVGRSNQWIPLVALGEAEPPDGQDTTYDTRQTVPVWEYWDRACTITFVEDVPVKYAEHNTGQVPYFEAYAKPDSSHDPERKSRPTGFKQKWLVELLNRFWTMMGNVGYLYCYPTPVTETPLDANVPLAADGRPPHIEWEVGKHITLMAGQKLLFVSPPAEHMTLMSDLIQQALRLFDQSSGLGPAIRGVGGADQPGYALQQLIGASLLSLKPAIKQRDWMLARAIAYTWRLIETRIGEPVPVWGTNPDADKGGKKWLELGPDDIKGYYKVEVESKPLMGQLRISLGSFGASMVKARMMSRGRAMEELLGIEQPEDEMDDIAIDEMLETDPHLKRQMQETALKRAGLLPQGAPPGTQPQLPGAGPPMMPPPGVGATPALPGALPGPPGVGPGIGMPLQPPTPPMPGPTEAQMGAAMPGGRPAGGDRLGPMQPQPPPGGGIP